MGNTKRMKIEDDNPCSIAVLTNLCLVCPLVDLCMGMLQDRDQAPCPLPWLVGRREIFCKMQVVKAKPRMTKPLKVTDAREMRTVHLYRLLHGGPKGLSKPHLGRWPSCPNRHIGIEFFV